MRGSTSVAFPCPLRRSLGTVVEIRTPFDYAVAACGTRNGDSDRVSALRKRFYCPELLGNAPEGGVLGIGIHERTLQLDTHVRSAHSHRQRVDVQPEFLP